MTRTELYDRITQCLPSGYRYEIGQAVEEIWGQPFDGETQKINPATEESSVAAAIANEADFVSKSMTADEIMAGKMAKDLHQIREQLLDLGKYQTNILGGGGWDTLVRMDADAEELHSHLRRRWNARTPNPHNQ